jgi:hypothetical protein
MREHQDAYTKDVAKRIAAKEKLAAEADAIAAKEEKKEGDEEAKPEEEKKDGEGDVDMEKKEEEPAVDLSVDDDAAPVEISSSLDVESIDGKKTPLYKAWGIEDWILLTMRVELHLLIRAFKADVTDKDPERKGITPKNLAHYYELFMGKAFDPQAFGQTTLEKLLEYASDVVQVSGGVLTLKSKEGLPLTAFIKETEKRRRERESKLLAGDDSAKLEFKAPGQGMGKKGAKGGDKGKGKSNAGYTAGYSAKGYPQPPKGGKGYSPQVGGYGQPYAQKRPADDSYAAKRPRPMMDMSAGYGYGGYGKGYGYGKGK